MSTLPPLETLYEAAQGDDLPLPPELAELYGRLRVPRHTDRPHVAGNFVTTLDGVVSLNVPGQAGGGPISGFNEHDRMVMGLLRAMADIVIVGAGTVRAVSPQHVWTAPYIYPPLADAYKQLRRSLGKPEPPLNVIVTARGEVDLGLRVFQSGEVRVLIVTTRPVATRLCRYGLPPSVRIRALDGDGRLSAGAVLQAAQHARRSDMILVEGGPQLLGDFLAEHHLDELFLTVAPQIAGRDGEVERPALVAGKLFAPDHPLWGTLTSVKRGGSHLFLRYTLESRGETFADRSDEAPGLAM